MKTCDVCGRGAGQWLCRGRGLVLCPWCIVLYGRLGGFEHLMPRSLTVCAHRRPDSLAVRLGGGESVLYENSPGVIWQEPES